MDQLTKVNGQTLIYDEIGNLEIYDNHRYEWVKASQLESISGPKINASYTYDYTGLRKSKTTGGVTTEFIWAGGLLMAQIGSDGNTFAWHYDQSGKMMGFTLNSTPYFYLRNQQGDIVAILDASGNVVAEYEYDAWGKVLSAEGPLAGVNPIRYRGYYWDWESSMYYLQSRYYSPELCRFISADVFMDTGDGILGTNMYAYCHNNPVFLSDPSGTKSSFKISGIGIANSDIMNIVKFYSFITSLFGVSFSPSESTLIDMAVRLGTERIANELGMEISDMTVNAIFDGHVLSGFVEFQSGGSTWSFPFVAGRSQEVLAFGKAGNDNIQAKTSKFSKFGEFLLALGGGSDAMLTSSNGRFKRMTGYTSPSAQIPPIFSNARNNPYADAGKLTSVYTMILKAIPHNASPSMFYVVPTDRLRRI